jgi:ferredoxin-NADP reductase
MPLQATIKKSGDFTNTIGETIPGDKALIEAPFGRFSFVHDNPKSFLFIAGGVGVTPIMSMLRYLRDTNDKRKALLIYGNKTPKDIVFRDELDKMLGWLKIVHIMSEPDSQWTGARGFVTREFLEKNAGDLFADAHVYLCGPPIMMKKVTGTLKNLGISKKRIHYELFSL